MIRPAQVALLERARAFLVQDGRHGDVLGEYPSCERVKALSESAFQRLLIRAQICGFRDRRSPILSLRTLSLVAEARDEIGLSIHAYQTMLRRRGIADLRDMHGMQLLDLLTDLEDYKVDVNVFQRLRGPISSKMVSLVHVARTKIGVPDARLFTLLQVYGGVNSTAQLDGRGFDLVMALLEAEGFGRQPAPAREKPMLGARPGFASPEQLGLILQLWREWSGADDEAALAAWLERFHAVSALRFLTAAAAGKVITALKAMKRRRAAKPDTAA